MVLKNLLDNPDFNGQFDYEPYIETGKDEQRRWNNFMSGNFAWRHAVNPVDLQHGLDDCSLVYLQNEIYDTDASTEGAMYCTIIAGADKTTVSVATGNVEYHPLYISIGNIYNSIRQAHRNAVVPIGFLVIPKGMSLPTT